VATCMNWFLSIWVKPGQPKFHLDLYTIMPNLEVKPTQIPSSSFRFLVVGF